MVFSNSNSNVRGNVNCDIHTLVVMVGANKRQTNITGIS